MPDKSRYSWVAGGAGAALVLGGGLVSAGWLARNATLASPGPGHATVMVMNTALLFTLWGLVLLSPTAWAHRHTRFAAGLGWGLLLAPLALLAQRLELPMNLDWPGLHRWADAKTLHPGRMPIAEALALAAAAVAFLLGRAKLREEAPGEAHAWTQMAARCLTVLVGCLGATALAAALVDANLLFYDYILADMNPYTAGGLLLLAVGLRAQAKSSGPERGDAASVQMERITTTSAVTLSCMALIAGISSFAILQGRVQALVGDNVLADLDNRSAMFNDFLALRDITAQFTSTRPTVINHLQKIQAGDDASASLANVQSVVDGFLKLGFSGLRYSDAEGRTVAEGGRFVLDPVMSAPLDAGRGSELLWDNGFVLRHRLPIVDAHGRLGAVMVDQPLPVLNRITLSASRLGETTEVGLCRSDGDLLRCFPQPANPKAYTTPLTGTDGQPLSMARALRGERGVWITHDYRGRNVIAAFGPIDRLGLGLVVKIDTVEIFRPIREQLLLGLAVLGLLVAAGTWLLRSKVKPLVTSLVESVKALQENQAQFRTVVAGVKDYAIIMLDVEGRVRSWNAGAEAIKGYQASEIIGQHFSRFYPEVDIARGKPAYEVREVIAHGRFEDEGWRLRKDGTPFWANVVITALRDDAGQLRGFVKFTRDMSERRQLENVLQEKNAELERASRAKDLFLASMSHELRTPLNAIIGFTGTLLMKLPGPLLPEQEKQLRTVQGSGRHLLSLINDLLHLAKLDADQAAMRREPVDAGAAVEEVAALLRAQAEKAGLRLIVSLPPESLTLMTNKRALTQILINLLGNAIKFTEVGTVEIALTRSADNDRAVLRFVVSDTGPGISEEDQRRLFTAFARVPSASGVQPEGTGLGLHLSRTLAEKLDGRLTLESTYGQGSRFCLELPASA